MGFWRCYYHIIWTTKYRASVITPQVEISLRTLIEATSKSLDTPLLAINMVEDHVHIAACIPPRIAVSEWMRRVKGTSAHEINSQFPDLPDHFRWQQRFGVLTFGAKNVDFVVDYVHRQKGHHANGSI